MEQPTDFGTFRQPEAAIRRWRSAAQAEPGKCNLAIGVLSRAGPVSLAAALRRHARNPAPPLAALGISLG